MTVTKQQQLEWLAKTHEEWPFVVDYTCMSHVVIGFTAFTPASHRITQQQWQQERDKMISKPEIDSSWHERGEFPPAGCECQFFSDGYDDEWFDWCIFHGLATCGGLIIEHHHRTSPSRVTVALFDPASTKFRPLRTEREKAIEEISTLVRDGLVSHEIAKEFAIKMHDAGLKLVKR